jgi:hypothetical protein
MQMNVDKNCALLCVAGVTESAHHRLSGRRVWVTCLGDALETSYQFDRYRGADASHTRVARVCHGPHSRYLAFQLTA